MVGWTGWLLGGLAGWLAGKGYEIGFVNYADRSRCIVRTAEEVCCTLSIPGGDVPTKGKKQSDRQPRIS